MMAVEVAAGRQVVELLGGEGGTVVGVAHVDDLAHAGHHHLLELLRVEVGQRTLANQQLDLGAAQHGLAAQQRYPVSAGRQGTGLHAAIGLDGETALQPGGQVLDQHLGARFGAHQQRGRGVGLGEGAWGGQRGQGQGQRLGQALGLEPGLELGAQVGVAVGADVRHRISRVGEQRNLHSAKLLGAGPWPGTERRCADATAVAGLL
jgi:hypothetical protein